MGQMWRVVVGGGAAIGAAALALAPWIQHKPVPSPEAVVTTPSPLPELALSEPVGAAAAAAKATAPQPLARLIEPPIGAARADLPAARQNLARTNPPQNPPAQYIVKIEQSPEFDAIYALWRHDPEAARQKFRQWCASRDRKSSTLLEKLDLADTSPYSNEIILQSKVPAENAQQSRQMASDLSAIPGIRYAEPNFSTNIEADKR